MRKFEKVYEKLIRFMVKMCIEIIKVCFVLIICIVDVKSFVIM